MEKTKIDFEKASYSNYGGGYNGYSMSNRAVAAYEAGERPKSQWSKSAILEELEALELDTRELKRLPLAILRDLTLTKSSWHHTSSRYNRTDFYMVGLSEDLTASEVDELIASHKRLQAEKRAEKEAKKLEKPKRVRFAYLEWGGTRRHPKATECVAEGDLIDGWIHASFGRKALSTRGVRIIEFLD